VREPIGGRRSALITGGGGQLATELVMAAPRSWEVHVLGRNQLDITSQEAVFDSTSTLKPDIVFNAAAYTKVDQAETDREMAFAVNENGVANLAKACSRFGGRLLHISTDFVFDGRNNRPYTSADATSPVNVYGESKLAGENKVLQLLPNRGSVFRTSWLYSIVGTNFVRTILRLIAQQRDLAVVDDQIGSPTWARGLARVLWAAAEDDSVRGLFHWSDSGGVSWYEFAVAIQEEAVSLGRVDSAIPIRRIGTDEYPTRATRPRYSVLDSSATAERLAIPQSPWRAHLHAMMDEVSVSAPPNC
jgi:dTDP-4-dehydrorhamnose reductase